MNLKILNNSTALTRPEINCVVDFRGLRRDNLPYIFIWIVYYAWVIAFASWWTASPLTENVFNPELRSLMHSISLISTLLFVFIIKKEWFVKSARIGAILIIAGTSIFLASPNMHMQLFLAVIIAMAIGCVNISIMIPFVFTLNNTEKLYAVVGSNVLIQFIMLFQEGNLKNNLQGSHNLLLSFIILTVAMSATLFFKNNCATGETDDKIANTPEFHTRVYLTLFFNCVIVILCKGAGKGVLNITAVNSDMPILMWYYIGGLAGCLIFLAVYTFSVRAYLWLGNITFASAAMGLLCNAFALRIPGMAIGFAVLLGIGSTVGMINMYYIIGIVGKKYNSMHYLKLSILIIGIFGGVSGIVVGNLVSRINTFEISAAASIISVTVMLLILILSPMMAQTYFENDWAKDSQNTEIDNEQLYLFMKYQLSRREIEVCKLLLQGYTLRQISGILSIAYSTVNTYCTCAYRKLGINSRTELLLLFKDYTIK